MQVRRHQKASLRDSVHNVALTLSIAETLTDYYETVLTHSKFKDQRAYCRKKLFEIEPHFAKGYFKSDK